MTILPSAGLRARVALDKHGFRTTHSLGQNFLLDEIDVRPEDRVLEIGPGAGVMTALLAERAEKVLAVELDERLALLEQACDTQSDEAVREALRQTVPTYCSPDDMPVQAEQPTTLRAHRRLLDHSASERICV